MADMEKSALQLVDGMRGVERCELLKLLAKSVHEMTLLGRSFYDSDESVIHLRQTNESIHRLAGHLRDLCNPEEPFTESRAAGIGADLASLGPGAIARLVGSC